MSAKPVPQNVGSRLRGSQRKDDSAVCWHHLLPTCSWDSDSLSKVGQFPPAVSQRVSASAWRRHWASQQGGRLLPKATVSTSQLAQKRQWAAHTWETLRQSRGQSWSDRQQKDASWDLQDSPVPGLQDVVILHMCGPIRQPPATCGCWALAMWCGDPLGTSELA